MPGKKGMKQTGTPRPNNKRPNKYTEPTKPVVIRVPESKVPAFRLMAAEWLKQYEAPK